MSLSVAVRGGFPSATHPPIARRQWLCMADWLVGHHENHCSQYPQSPVHSKFHPGQQEAQRPHRTHSTDFRGPGGFDARSYCKRLLIGLAIAASVAGGALVEATPTHAAAKVGPVDQFRYLKPWCERQMQVGTILGSASPDNPWNAYSWKCRVAGFYRTAGIDMNAVCRAYYGGNTWAKTNNPGWAWSWECWRS